MAQAHSRPKLVPAPELRRLPGMPQAQWLEGHELRLVVYEAGPTDHTKPAIVLAHGFPEIAYSWRHQIPSLAQAGYRVLVPDQRGYGFSERPQAVEAYDMAHLMGDLLAILDACDIEKAIFCGHDWGGLVTWALPLFHPDRVLGMIGVNTPFLPRLPVDPVMALQAAFGSNHYVVFFQTPDAPEALFEQDLDTTFRFFMRRSDLTHEEFLKRPPEMRNLALQTALERFKVIDDPAGAFGGEGFLSPEDLQIYVDHFAHSGFRGPIHWYRNMARNWAMSAEVAQHVPHPSLMIMAQNDVVLHPGLANGMERFVPDLERVLIENCGHWTQQEHPDQTNKAILSWLARRFG